MAETHGLVTVLLMFLEILSLTEPKEANVTCIIHDDCILPCSFRPTGTVVIHWYKQIIPVHSYYYDKDQFGLQNKHFSGRTCLFNSQITNGNASLLLRRVKVQDKGRYKCYTSTRKGNQETFVNLEVKALIQSVNIEMTEDTVSCSCHNVYPAPQVTWATEPPSSSAAQQNSTTKVTDYKGLLKVESALKIVGNLSDHAYICTFTSADKTQVWTASRRNQDTMAREEGHKLSIPCISPLSLQNFSLTWTFTKSSESTVILRYDSRIRHTFNLWEGRAELDQDLVLVGDGSLLLDNSDSQEHSGTYTCMFSGPQSRHTVQTRVNLTAASISVDTLSIERSCWSTAASVAFVLFTISVTFAQCLRHKDTAIETRATSHRQNGVLPHGSGPDEHLSIAASHLTGPHTAEAIILQIQSKAQELEDCMPDIGGNCPVESSAGTKIEQTEGPPVAENDGLQPCNHECVECGSIQSGPHVPQQHLVEMRPCAQEGNSVVD